MPLFEIDAQEELVPFRQLHGGAELYEREIEDLLWGNLEELTGESLFPIARQPSITAGGRPDIVALDANANVVVLEVKRDVDRGQLAQCLEYAGWARTTSLDELARLYHSNLDSFFADWQVFTESNAPVVLTRSPRLMLVARDFHGRTESALEFLIENGLPVKLIRAALYQDQEQRRFIDVEGEHEPEFAVPTHRDVELIDRTKISGRRVRLSDLLEYGLLQPGDTLTWERPRVGDVHRATVTDNGAIQLASGEAYSSPSRAAVEAANVPAYDGWLAWRCDRTEQRLDDMRRELVTRLQSSEA